MGGNRSQFIHHKTGTPGNITYMYTRSNKFGAVESRCTTTSSKYGVVSTVVFSDGHGHVDNVRYIGNCCANNFDDYNNDNIGPDDGFNKGDYSYLYSPPVCTCGNRCGYKSFTA